MQAAETVSARPSSRRLLLWPRPLPFNAWSTYEDPPGTFGIRTMGIRPLWSAGSLRESYTRYRRARLFPLLMASVPVAFVLGVLAGAWLV